MFRRLAAPRWVRGLWGQMARITSPQAPHRAWSTQDKLLGPVSLAHIGAAPRSTLSWLQCPAWSSSKSQ